MSASRFYKRFPVQRRRRCVPVTSARPNEVKNGPQQARAVAEASGDGVSPEGDRVGAGRSEIKRIKGVVEK
jgi:hypothetical protein